MTAHLRGEWMDQLPVLIPEEQIKAKIAEVAKQIEKDYQGKDLVIVMVLKGALCFVADLVREIHLPLNIEAVQCSSYGASGSMRGELRAIGMDTIHVHNRDVLIVDDIFDSGHTLTFLVQAIEKLKPHSLKTCVLLSKKVPRKFDIQPDYVLFDIENDFVVGYGLDYKELYRGLPSIHIFDPLLQRQ